jgi:hypothetical protein
MSKKPMRVQPLTLSPAFWPTPLNRRHFQTIPSLIDGLHDMTAAVVKQRKVTNTYSKVFLDCVDCKP